MGCAGCLFIFFVIGNLQIRVFYVIFFGEGLVGSLYEFVCELLFFFFDISIYLISLLKYF